MRFKIDRHTVWLEHHIESGDNLLSQSFLYELTPTAEYLFPKSYGAVLVHLLEVLSERMAPEEMEELLRAIGRRIAAQQRLVVGDLHSRLEAAVELLNELGGMAELEPHEGTYRIVGYSCPLAAAVPAHPAVCCLAETLLTEAIGVPVQQQCHCSEPLCCCFVVSQV